MVSVVIPVYGVERDLPKCLDSVCCQTYSNLEILVIDDESPDLSGKIADEYAEKDSRVKVFHIKNRGAAGARNVGLDNCSGKYIFFVDSDDWLEANAIEIMIEKLNKDDCDVVQCQYIDEYINKSENHIYHEDHSKCDDKQFIKDMIPHWEYILIWNKLYKKELFENVRFVEGRCIDDEFFTYKVIANSKKITLINDFLYHYRLRKSGAMGNVAKVRQRLIDQIDFVTQRYGDLIQKYPDLKVCLLEHLLEVLMMVLRNSGNYVDVYKEAKKHFNKYGFKALLNSSISLSMKKSIISYMLKNRKKHQPDKRHEDMRFYFD